MATKTLSAITSGGSLVAATDKLVAVRSGTTDVLVTPSTIAGTGALSDATGTVSTAQIANLAVTSAQIANGTVTGTQLATNSNIMSSGVTFDGGGSALTSGKTGYVTCPFAGTIVGWNITADAGTCTIDIWKIATGTAIPTVTNTITAAALPALASGTAIHSTNLTGWTTSVAANDIFGFNLSAVATATKITLVLQINKT